MRGDHRVRVCVCYMYRKEREIGREIEKEREIGRER